MNILHLEASSGWGGQEIRILQEAQGMRARGHNVLLAVSKGGALIEKGRALGFFIYELDFRRCAWPITLFRLLSIIRRDKIEIINTHSSLDSWIGGIAGRIARKKVLRTRHLSTPIKAGFNSRFLYGTLADFVVTTCASILPMIIEQSKKPANRCRSIPTGVDPEKVRVFPDEVSAFRQKMGLLPDDFVVGTACFMRSWKGIDDLLKAADLLRNVPQLKWVIVGGGHMERHLRFAKELKLENVIFTGHLDRPFPAMATFDLFALLSTANEGVSQAILQAALLEKPLLSTRIGGLGEVCIDQVTGFNVSPLSPNEVAAAVLKLKENPQLRVRFAKQAKELVLNQFTFNQTLDQMEEVYALLQM